MSKFAYLAKRYIVPATTEGDGPRSVFDIETDGLLDTATTVHCIVVADLGSERVDEYGPEQITAALVHLARASYLIGHNIIGFDLPVLQRLYGWAPPSNCTVMDTLIAGRLILPHLRDLDDKAAAMGEPKLGKLRGRYSLEAWGVRLGIHKVGTDITDWSKWTPEMQERCVADAAICKALWLFLQPDGYSQQAVQLEHRVAPICNRITADGVPFDTAAAEHLHQQWAARRSQLEAQLKEQFPGTKLSSRVQIAALLEARGWKPEKRTEKTKQPCIDDELLETIPALYPEFTGLSEHYILGRRLGQLTNGKEAWCKRVTADGRIHGGLIHIGTPHSRAKHLAPNLAQVPNQKKGKPFATECRALFRAPDEWVFVAADQSNLQDRGFAHYLSAFDGGAYTRAFLNGADTHWQTTTALDLVTNDTSRDKQDKLHTSLREGAKRFRYAFLYGCGAEKAGTIINDTVRAAQQLNPASTLQQKLFGAAANPNTPALIKAGKRALAKFEDATPGLRTLRARLKAHAYKHTWLPGLDGRRVPVRALYSALNFIITSSEAIICKRWLVRVHDELCERFRYGWNGDVVIVLWVHDELVCCCRPEIAEQVGEIMVRHAIEPGEFYKFKVPLAAEFKISNSWAGEIGRHVKLAGEIPDRRERTQREGAKFSNDFDGAPNLASSAKDHTIAADGKICCPFHDDKTPSCQLYTDGHYHCFGCGAHGPIDDDLDVDDAVLAARAADKEQDKEKNRARALRLWERAVPILGTTAACYLSAVRGVDLAELPPDVDQVLRFHPRCPFGSGARHPCLVALMRSPTTDEPTGIHRIALTPEGHKIDRYMLGYAGAVKLWPAGSQLIVGEGIETVLAAATRIPYRDAPLRPAWSLLSASALERLPVLPGVERLIVLVDHDTGGKNAARICADRWQRAGRTIVRLTPKRAGADFNDLILPECVP